jgi:protein-tyrosine phosphatase
MCKAEVPDPYYGEGDSGFHEVVDLIEAASDGLIEQLEVRFS